MVSRWVPRTVLLVSLELDISLGPLFLRTIPRTRGCTTWVTLVTVGMIIEPLNRWQVRALEMGTWKLLGQFTRWVYLCGASSCGCLLLRVMRTLDLLPRQWVDRACDITPGAISLQLKLRFTVLRPVPHLRRHRYRCGASAHPLRIPPCLRLKH